MWYYLGMKTRARGFTLVELLIAVSLIAILTGALIPSFSSYIQSQGLKQAQEQVKNDLRTTQNNAITGVDSQAITHWGILFTPNSTTYTFVTLNKAIGSSIAVSDCAIPPSISKSISTALNSASITRNSVRTCVFFSVSNGDTTLVDSSVKTTCTEVSCYIIVGKSGGTTCYRVGLNYSGLVKNITASCT